MQYSRNLDPESGTGIELVTITRSVSDAIEAEPANLISALSLYPNYPNPFNATTTIRYTLKAPARVELKVYDLTGKLVSVLENNYKTAGEFVAVWNGETIAGQKAPSGVYVYQLNMAVGKQLAVASRKMLLLK
jgi:hypothetical protein